MAMKPHTQKAANTHSQNVNATAACQVNKEVMEMNAEDSNAIAAIVPLQGPTGAPGSQLLPKEYFFLFISIEPRVEWYKSL